jgi:hypothetical protein
MHSGQPYGHLTVKDDAALAKLVGMTPKTTRKFLKELEKNGVISSEKTEKNREISLEIFSPRMVRDYEKHLKRQDDGGKGGNPALRPEVNHEVKPSDTRGQRPERKEDDASRHKPREGTTEKEESKPSSVASSFEAVPLNETPQAKLFRVGKPALISMGVSEKQSGRIIGRWLKQKNDPDGILAALEYAAARGIIEPISYVTKCLSTEPKNGKRKPISPREWLDQHLQQHPSEQSAGGSLPEDIAGLLQDSSRH